MPRHLHWTALILLSLEAGSSLTADVVGSDGAAGTTVVVAVTSAAAVFSLAYTTAISFLDLLFVFNFILFIYIEVE